MKRFRKFVQKVSTFLPKGFLVFGVFSLLSLPLTSNAKEVVIWELDNWFSVEGGSSPDGVRTEFNIEAGDTIKFINMGGTDHDAGNLLFTADDGRTFFEKDVFGGAAQSPGDTFTTLPIDIVGEIPFQCFIHGSPDMDGVLIASDVATETPTPTDGTTPGPTVGPTPTATPTEPEATTLSISCDRPLRTLANMQVLRMSFIEEADCVITLVDPQPNVTIVSDSVDLPRRSIAVVPPSGITDEDGSVRFRIVTGTPGVNLAFISFGVLNEEDDSVTYNDRAFGVGAGSGFLVISAPRTQ